jgi:hypothetical protein
VLLPIGDFALELLADPSEGLGIAEKFFPGADPTETCLREALAAIVAAQAYSAEVAVNLATLRKIGTLDPEELEDSLGGETFIEIDLKNAAGSLEAALQECRCAHRMLRRSRSRRRRQCGRNLQAVP